MTATDRPEDYRKIWKSKPILRVVYTDFYRRIAERLADGTTLEIGGGSGNLKAFAPSVISSDVTGAPWLDMVCDAQSLPIRSGCLANIVMVDVLHHVERPVRLLREAVRTLRPGGRVVLCEPAITPVSYPFYCWFHSEPVDMSADPLSDGPLDPNRSAWTANQAIPSLIFGRKRQVFADTFPELALIEVARFSFLAYPGSGGFRSWSLIPVGIARGVLKVEWAVRRQFGPIAAFRMLVTIEKRQS
ncbi:MAG: class I SAM-dependent methyltransferase [Rhodospirillaceae bacterium]|nr:class I SAM-dependent methyltransferase [Rhodospirillaceae bacterium]MCY4310400.1 class I SAM-dependent methyltransferase [Rhodospirillaceae bacterium]